MNNDIIKNKLSTVDKVSSVLDENLKILSTKTLNLGISVYNQHDQDIRVLSDTPEQYEKALGTINRMMEVTLTNMMNDIKALDTSLDLSGFDTNIWLVLSYTKIMKYALFHLKKSIRVAIDTTDKDIISKSMLDIKVVSNELSINIKNSKIAVHAIKECANKLRNLLESRVD